MARTKQLARPIVDDAVLLPRDLAGQAKWINPEGDAIASKGQLSGWVQSFFSNTKTLASVTAVLDRTRGELLHVIGTILREIRGHSAWKLVDVETWELYCEEVLTLSRRHADRLVAFAGAVTAEQAAFGPSKCFAGIALVERLGLESLSDLIPPPGKPEPAKWAELLGAPVQFVDSSANRLEKLLAGEFLPKVEPVTKEEVAELVAARQDVIDRLRPKLPVIDELNIRSFQQQGEARLRLGTPSTSEQIDGLWALLGALRKL